MTLRELWIHALREEGTAIRSLLRALEYALDASGRTQRSLCQLCRSREV